MILAEGKVEFTGSRLHFSINFGSARVIWATARKDAGVVDRDGLENRCILSGTEGSNPSLSATVLSGVEPLLKRKSLAETVFRRGFLFFSPRRRSLEVKLQRPRGEWRGGAAAESPGRRKLFPGRPRTGSGRLPGCIPVRFPVFQVLWAWLPLLGSQPGSRSVSLLA